MAPLLVERMPGIPSEGLAAKKIHPFFSGQPTPSTDASQASPDSVKDDDFDSTLPSDRRKRRKKACDADPGELQRKRRGRRKKNVWTGPSLEDLWTKATSDDDGDDEYDAPLAHTTVTSEQSSVAAFSENANPPAPAFTELADMSNPSTEPLTPPLLPKKMLMFNAKTGTIGSPPRKPSMIVVIKYGTDEESRRCIGQKIRDVLEGIKTEPMLPPPRKRGRPRKSAGALTSDIKVSTSSAPTNPLFAPYSSKSATAAASAATNSETPTHPFFTGGLKKATPASEATAPTPEAAPKPEPRRAEPKIAMSTPCLSRARQLFRPAPVVSLPQYGVRLPGVKVPGVCDAAWPPNGMVHVRDAHPLTYTAGVPAFDLGYKRSKGRAVQVPAVENVLSWICQRLDCSILRPRPVSDNELMPRDPSLQLPTKHLESGRQLQKRIRPELRTWRHPTRVDHDHDELDHSSLGGSHAAVSRLYNRLQSELPAFDRSDCENAMWSQKYAPRSANEVLQSSRECLLLKEWLQTLQVQTVDAGAAEVSSHKGHSSGKFPARKKRRKAKLEGFVVSSDDEEGEEMDELLPEGEDNWANISSSDQAARKTVMRNGDLSTRDGRRLANAVVISGPHGCGKTAAVYAVAKELDFEVFELHPGSRRSGKDLMEKVGDMTRNHLVQRHRADEDGRPAEAEENSVKSDKQQGALASFLKPKKASKTKRNTSKKDNDRTDAKTTTVAPSKQQKQSLILIEEADVFFEEDKQFWSTLMTMMASSKRPFVLTCSEESLLPMQTLTLQGIFRFAPMPVDLAVDVLLLVAANEGHALRRDAVEALYQSRGHDMRASLAELNYWCQIGVGDQRGGFDWFFARWPRGCDLDERGDAVRVVSEGTYTRGMGWFGRDASFAKRAPLEADEQVVGEAWHHWQLDLPGAADQVGRVRQRSLSDAERLAALDRIGAFYDSLSEADVISWGSLATGVKERLDPTLPDMPAKTRDDFIVGQHVLDALLLHHQSPLASLMSSSLRSLAVRRLHDVPCSTAVFTSAIASDHLLSSLKITRSEPPLLSRKDISTAFDPIAAPESVVASTAPSSSSLDPSVFDGTLSAIVLDVAPWVRSIVAYDQRLMRQRRQLSGRLSSQGSSQGPQGLVPAKRMRNTRTALSALEGGCRVTTRRENWFPGGVNPHLVARTAGSGWEAAAMEDGV